MPSLNVWTPSTSWLEQKLEPAAVPPPGPQTEMSLATAINKYSPLTLQLGLRAYSRPPPTAHVALPALPVVESKRGPQGAVLQVSVTETTVSRMATPPFT